MERTNLVKIRKASCPVVALIAIVLLTFLQLVYDAFFIISIIYNWEQRTVAFFGAIAFVLMAIIIDIYRRYFVDDVIVEKIQKVRKNG